MPRDKISTRFAISAGQISSGAPRQVDCGCGYRGGQARRDGPAHVVCVRLVWYFACVSRRWNLVACVRLCWVSVRWCVCSLVANCGRICFSSQFRMKHCLCFVDIQVVRYTGGRFRTSKTDTCIAFAKQKTSLGVTGFDDFPGRAGGEINKSHDSCTAPKDLISCSSEIGTQL